MSIRSSALLVALMFAFVACAGAESLRNVPPAEAPRFEVTDRVWPAKVGEASICLWDNDHLAAISLTIDDNWAPDHAWWLETGERYQARFTWFVIASRLKPEGGFFGSPDDFSKLRAAGHDVQSHTVDHFSGEAALDTDTNYRQAIEMIERDVKGARVLTLAYPGGANAKNDRSLAEKYYIAARSTRGHINPANRVDYMDASSLGTALVVDAENRVGAANLITRNPARANVYRGWASYHFHGLDNPKAPTGELKAKVIAFFDWVREQGDAFWVAPFTEVAQYGQQRDTATLKMNKLSEREWEMELTDRMDDALFDLPLTVKLRLDDGWESIAARQGDKDLRVRIVEHEGAKYALVWAVPDRGMVRLTAK